MSDVRTMTAAELAADTEEARAVWAAWGRREINLTMNFLDSPVLAIKPFSGGNVRVRTKSGWKLWNGANPVFVSPVRQPKPTYAELEAALARIDAVLAKLPGAPLPRISNHYVNGINDGKHMARVLLEAARKGDTP